MKRIKAVENILDLEYNLKIIIFIFMAPSHTSSDATIFLKYGKPEPEKVKYVLPRQTLNYPILSNPLRP